MTNNEGHRDRDVSKRSARRRADLFEQALALQEALDRELLNDPDARAEYEDARRRRTLFKTFAWARRYKQMSQADIARIMETSQSAISDIEQGQKDPRLSTLQRLARALGFELRVHLSMGPWVILYSWKARDLAYGTSAQEMRIMHEADDLWIAVIQNQRESDGHEQDISVRRLNVEPVSVRAPGEDNFLTRGDLDQLCLSHSPMSALPSVAG
ncbi:helix-turn-helix domain-containing protein [Micromonospora sp. PLK6-60]|uniref:helix-turn-helix domain-containing protein n=1 Tax=Micromonospora sp. PLK6-60 TaxID=2873383 RepID=UPI001CA6E194|nr:helix-turn-helix domain-containing protein [Micromonospora sp. PLK6-60]MBY8871832.1 helix-turn-helix domain-containing protein [Micromonospora sp. PLK6-60]